MVLVTVSPVQHCLAEKALGSNTSHHEYQGRLLVDQLSNLLVLPFQHDQIHKKRGP